MKRKINKVIIHCSATPPDRDVTAAEVDRWHRARGFLKIGYHHLIRRDGTVEKGRDHTQSGAHAKGHNRYSIGICMVGGVDALIQPQDNFMMAQWLSLKLLVKDIVTQYPTIKTIIGHYSVSHKACPSFSVEDWLEANPDILNK